MAAGHERLGVVDERRQRVAGHEPGRRDAAPREQLEQPLRADARPELGVAQLHRRVAAADRIRHGVVVDGDRDGQAGCLGHRVLRRRSTGRSVASPTVPFGPGPRPPVSLALDGHHRTGLLRHPRRRADRVGRRDQARLPQARPAVAPGRQQGPGGPGAVQGDQRGVPGPVRPGSPSALRHLRQGRRRRRRGGPGFEGFGGFSDIFDAFFGGGPGVPARPGAAARSPARTCATTCGSRSRRRSRAPSARSSSARSSPARPATARARRRAPRR